MAGADLVILVGVLVLWQWIWRYAYRVDADRDFARIVSSVVAAFFSIGFLDMLMSNVTDGLVAYFSPLVWLAMKMAGAA